MEKNRYKYYSGHHSNINMLHRVVTNYRYATVLDRFAFYSINSNFILPREYELNGWFCIEYKSLGEMTGYSERSIKAIVKLFTTMGLIEKVRKLIKNKCRACIRITSKTIALLGLTKTCEQRTEQTTGSDESCALNTESRKNLAQQCTFKSTENSLTYNEYREKEKDINIITRVPRCEKQGKLYNVPKAVTEIFVKVGERLPESQKATIWAAIYNLQKQHHKKISNISEFVAWISFSVINAKYQLKKAFNFQHQLNKLIKIARSPNGLQKPRGFHNHWDIGQELKLEEHTRLKQHEKLKQAGQGDTETPSLKTNDLDNHGSYMVAKKSSEIWNDKGDIKSLKDKRGKLNSVINSLMNELKELPIIYKETPELLRKATVQAQAELKEFKIEHELIVKEINKLKEDKHLSKSQEWVPLYA